MPRIVLGFYGWMRLKAIRTWIWETSQSLTGPGCSFYRLRRPEIDIFLHLARLGIEAAAGAVRVHCNDTMGSRRWLVNMKFTQYCSDEEHHQPTNSKRRYALCIQEYISPPYEGTNETTYFELVVISDFA